MKFVTAFPGREPSESIELLFEKLAKKRAR